MQRNHTIKQLTGQLILFIFLLLSIFELHAQSISGYNLKPDNCCPFMISKETSIWYFGKGAGLDFNVTPPGVLFCPAINQLEGGATLCDTSGQFILSANFSTGAYTMELMKSDFETVDGSKNLPGHFSASQNCLIIPQPGKENIYFVFTVGVPLPSPYGKGLSYSVVNWMNNDSLIKNSTELLFPVSEKITAVVHENLTDVWIIGHEWNSRRFFSWLLTSSGMQAPVISETGTEHTADDFNNNAIGCLKASPDGCKLALAIYGMGIIELFDFDKSNGVVNSRYASDPVYTGVYGIEFSGDSKMLYATTNDYCYNNDFESGIYQFSINGNSNPFTEPVEIAVSSSIDYLSLQLARDGKIYVAQSVRANLPGGGYEYVGIIHNPTRRNLCNFNLVDHQPDNGLYLNGALCRIGLPNFVQSNFQIPKYLFRYNCFLDLTQFTLQNYTNVDSVHWDFGDGSFSKEINPEHTFPAPGTYNVKLKDYFETYVWVDSMLVDIYPLPLVKINGGIDTVILLAGFDVTLDAGAGYRTYSWNTGHTSQTIEVSTEGYYQAEVSNETWCYNRDTVFVWLANIVIPDAFVPSDGGDDHYFRIIDQENVINSLSIIIYSRTGQKVFESDSKYFQWDGGNYSTDVFYYTINMVMKNGINYRRNGNVTLLR